MPTKKKVALKDTPTYSIEIANLEQAIREDTNSIGAAIAVETQAKALRVRLEAVRASKEARLYALRKKHKIVFKL